MTTQGPDHPKYGAALSGHPILISGVMFYPYRRGIGAYIRCSEDGRIEIYYDGLDVCLVDGERRPKRFRTFDAAARAGIAKVKEGK